MTTIASWPWQGALVTGSSSGIGAALARHLAAGGVPRLVLVARRRDRLDALAAELARDHGTAVEVLVADLTEPAGCRSVEERLAAAGRPVDLLVNNAGLMSSGRFVAIDADDAEAMIRVNVVALTRLARAAASAMLARGGGTILNVSSMTSYQPSPGSATYAATKAFVTSLSEALHEELRGSGVSVTALLPGYTRTDPGPGRPGLLWLPAERVAREGIAAAAAGRALCIPGRRYRAVAALVTPLPRTARRRLMGLLTRRSRT